MGQTTSRVCGSQPTHTQRQSDRAAGRRARAGAAHPPAVCSVGALAQRKPGAELRGAKPLLGALLQSTCGEGTQGSARRCASRGLVGYKQHVLPW